MALSMKKAGQAIFRTAVANLISDSSTMVTPLMIGSHGIGKSNILKEIAGALNAEVSVMDASTIKEGEAGGMPFATTDEFGNFTTQFAMYYVFRGIQEYIDCFDSSKPEFAERFKEQNPGVEFKLKEVADVLGVKEEELKPYHLLDANADQRVQLIDRGLVKLHFVLIDEINRCSREVNQEMMNLILARTINGYNLPWTVQMVGAANPSGGAYSAEDMDPAQIDRFLMLEVVPNVNDWIEWGNSTKSIHPDVLQFIADTGDKFFRMDKDKINEGSQKANVSPRSWEAVSKIIKAFEDKKASNIIAKFQTTYGQIEKFDDETEMAELIAGKVGDTAQAAFMAFVNNAQNRITPQEIFTGEGTISRTVRGKVNKISSLRQKVLVENVLEYLQSNLSSLIKKDKDAFDSELTEFYNILDESNGLAFCAGFIKYKEITKVNGKEQEGKQLFSAIMRNGVKKFNKVLSTVVKEYTAATEEAAK